MISAVQKIFQKLSLTLFNLLFHAASTSKTDRTGVSNRVIHGVNLLRICCGHGVQMSNGGGEVWTSLGNYFDKLIFTLITKLYN